MSFQQRYLSASATTFRHNIFGKTEQKRVINSIPRPLDCRSLLVCLKSIPKPLGLPKPTILCKMVEEEPYVYYQGAKVPKAVTHVVIDPLVQIIERQAFAHCHALKSVSFPGALPTTGSNTTGSQLTRIGEFAFAECTSLKSIQIPASVEKIESSAFESCHFLKSVTFQRVGTSLAGLTHVGDDAFCNCYSLKSIEFPPSLTFLGIGAFFDCSCLTSVSFGHEESSLAHIGSNAFQSCRALKTIRIPACVTEIYDGTFEDCVDLQSVEFLEPSVLTEMGSRAFEGCTSLVTFVLPKPLLKLGAYAFQGVSLTCSH